MCLLFHSYYKPFSFRHPQRHIFRPAVWLSVLFSARQLSSVATGYVSTVEVTVDVFQIHDDPILAAVLVLRLPSTAMKETRKTLIGKCCAVLLLAWQWENSINRLQPSGHYMYRQFNIHNSTFCPHSVFMCFVWI